jgi:hypothetical protein
VAPLIAMTDLSRKRPAEPGEVRWSAGPSRYPAPSRRRASFEAGAWAGERLETLGFHRDLVHVTRPLDAIATFSAMAELVGDVQGLRTMT